MAVSEARAAAEREVTVLREALEASEARHAALRDAVLEFLDCLKYHEEGIGIYREHFDPDVKSPYLDDSHTAAALDELRRAARTGEE